jgi:hypothetical protein
VGAGVAENNSSGAVMIRREAKIRRVIFIEDVIRVFSGGMQGWRVGLGEIFFKRREERTVRESRLRERSKRDSSTSRADSFAGAKLKKRRRLASVGMTTCAYVILKVIQEPTMRRFERALAWLPRSMTTAQAGGLLWFGDTDRLRGACHLLHGVLGSRAHRRLESGVHLRVGRRLRQVLRQTLRRRGWVGSGR